MVFGQEFEIGGRGYIQLHSNGGGISLLGFSLGQIIVVGLKVGLDRRCPSWTAIAKDMTNVFEQQMLLA